MKKLKAKSHKSTSPKTRSRSLLFVLALVIGAALLAFLYATNTNPPLIAGVLDDYNYQHPDRKIEVITKDGRTQGVDVAKEYSKSTFKKELDQSAKEGAAAVAAHAASIAAGENQYQAEKKAKEAMKTVASGATYTPPAGTEQLYKNSLSSSEAQIAASLATQKAVLKLLETMSPEKVNECFSSTAVQDPESDCGKARSAGGDAYANFLINNDVKPGASCAGGSAGVGIGHNQWAQTGRGLNEKGEVCNQSGCSFRECIKCQDGNWDNASRTTCGQGSATNYIVRPDQVVRECNDSDPNNDPSGGCGGARNNCWSNGAWYSDSSSVGGRICSAGKLIAEDDTGKNNLSHQEQVLQDVKQACNGGQITPDCAGNILYGEYRAIIAAQAYLERSQTPPSTTKSFTSLDSCNKAKSSNETCISTSASGGSNSFGSALRAIDNPTARVGVTWKVVKTPPGATVTQSSGVGTARSYTTFTWNNTSSIQQANNLPAGGSTGASTPDSATPEKGSETEKSYTGKWGYNDCFAEQEKGKGLCVENGDDGQYTSYKLVSTPENSLSGGGEGNNDSKDTISVEGVAENQELLTAYRAAIETGAKFSKTTYDECSTNPDCVAVKNGKSTLYIDKSEVANKLENNSNATYIYKYMQILDKNSSEFKTGSVEWTGWPGFGGNGYVAGEYRTKGVCEKQYGECVKVPGKLVFNYLPKSAIDSASERLGITEFVNEEQ